MIHPDTEIGVVDTRIGLGVRATRPIPRGTIVWALDRFDIRLAPADFESLGPMHRALAERYGYREADGNWIVCWDGGRYVNHSCDPAMRGVGADMMIARREISTGDELTCDYAECNLDPPMDCLCDAEPCRGRISGADLLVHYPAWDAEIRSLLPLARRVSQPLEAAMLHPSVFREIVDGTRPVPSLREVCRAPDVSA